MTMAQVIWQRMVCLGAVAVALALAACGTTEGQREDDSPIPWNTPERWEQQPNFGAPYTW